MTYAHRFFLLLMSLTVVLTLIMLVIMGYSYYRLPLEERFFDSHDHLLKPGGAVGHGLGIIGTFIMILGILLYMARKRMRLLSHLGRLSYWLEFHIFLCTLGPLLVLFHTSFKFGGIVAVSFWSMVGVFLSGVIGRFIYIQIPRTSDGREMTPVEALEFRGRIDDDLSGSYQLDQGTLDLIRGFSLNRGDTDSGNFLFHAWRNYLEDRRKIKQLKTVLEKSGFPHAGRKGLLDLVRKEIRLGRKIDRLSGMQNLFRYWHVAHLPFAILMLIIMVIHVAVTIVLGYRWIF